MLKNWYFIIVETCMASALRTLFIVPVNIWTSEWQFQKCNLIWFYWHPRWYRIFVLSDNYWLLLPLGSVIVLTPTLLMWKIWCTLVQALRFCTGCMTHRGSRGIALPFHDSGTRRGWRVSVTPRPLFTARKDPVLIVQEAEWAPGPVWTSAENLAPSGVRSPDCPARSQSLYRLRYPAHPKLLSNA